MLGNFLFSELFNVEFFSPAFRIYLFFVKNTYQKAADLMFGLILPVGTGLAWFLGGQFRDSESMGKSNGKKLSQIKKIKNKNKIKKILIKGAKSPHKNPAN